MITVRLSRFFRHAGLPVFIILFNAIGAAQQQPAISPEELREHIKHLASDELQGREVGSPGADAAAEYIAADFRRSGLQPLGDNGTFFQTFEFVAGVELGKENSASIASDGSAEHLSPGKDFRPLGFSASGSWSGGMVFAGYGISLPDKGYDDYANLDVAGKAVIVLRFHPDGDNPHSEFTAVSGMRYKANKAKELGAAALILVTGPSDGENDVLMPLAYDQSVGNAGIPAVSMTRKTVDALLSGTGKSVKSFQDEPNSKKKPGSFAIPNRELHLTVTLDEVRKKSSNVAGFLPGSDDALKEQTVILGAHYDHLGMGGQGSGSLSPDTIAIHNGADDNASGTAGLLELAEYFGARREQLKRGMLFLAFTGEERGLLGSAYYVKNPVLPLEKSIAMINMDMIGRPQNGKLIVYGMGTSPGFEALVRKHNADSTLDLKLLPDGFGPSDHSSFYGSKIPIFHFFTDLHSDYHKPSDDWNTINYDGMDKVVGVIAAVSADLNSQPER
ncbi:MAG TPA: M28 family peptidase, partial [Bacteroidota bacterium]